VRNKRGEREIFNMFQQYKFSVDNSTYNDNIQVHPAHFNSMRAKPILPQAIIEV
jgi:hypothetical protein